MVKYLLLDNKTAYDNLQPLLCAVVNPGITDQKVFNGFDASPYYAMQINTNDKLNINSEQHFLQLVEVFKTMPNVDPDLADILAVQSINQGYFDLSNMPNLRDYDFMVHNGFISEVL